MSLNRKDLKKIMYDFNSIANRLMKVNFQEYLNVLKKFLGNIENCEVIYDYIKDCGEPTFDVDKEVSSVSNSYGRQYLDLGDSEKEEVSNIYHVLKYIADNNMEIQYGLALSYDIGSNKLQDKIKGFNERVVLVLMRYIEGYLTKIGIDMGIDETIKYSITVTNGQVNLASDNAVINATQNNGLKQDEIKALIDIIMHEAPKDISYEEKEDISDSIEVIQNELSQQNPKKGLVRTALATLKAVNGTVEFGVAVSTLAQAIQSFI